MHFRNYYFQVALRQPQLRQGKPDMYVCQARREGRRGQQVLVLTQFRLCSNTQTQKQSDTWKSCCNRTGRLTVSAAHARHHKAAFPVSDELVHAGTT